LTGVTLGNLTDAKVAALKPRAKRYLEPDSKLPAFYCRVTPNGAKTFCCVARDPSNKQIWVTIGPSTLYSVEEARERARTTLKEIRLGEGTGPETFGAVARTWLKRHVAKNGLRSRPEIERVLAKYIMPKWAGRDFTSIKRGDVAALLDSIEDKHGSRQADYCLAVISGICNWFATRHNTYMSPLVRGMKRTDPKTRKRARVLDDDEIRAVWAACKPGDTFGDLLKILLLTAQRREKVATMLWADVNKAGEWDMPTDAREKGVGGVLVLPMLAVDIINARPRFASNPYIFAGRGKTHFSGYSKAKAALDKKLTLPGWVLHDLRRTARSLMARAGVRPDVAERVMGHAIAGVEGVYDRHSYRDEKAGALAALASLVSRILNPPADNVVALGRAR
jgi:integrase